MYRDSAKSPASLHGTLEDNRSSYLSLVQPSLFGAFLDLSAGRYDLLATFQKKYFCFYKQGTRECH